MPPKSRSTGLLTADEWIELPDEPIEGVVFGSPDEEIIEDGSKNIVEGNPKAFKTTFVQSLLLPASKGQTSYPQMPLFSKPRRVLYLHGEMSKRQIKKRTSCAARGLGRPLNNFLQVRDLDAHLINSNGQTVIERYVREAAPTDIVFDPWQSFIRGHDENNFVEVSKATSFIDRLIVEHSLTVWLPTHTGKDATKGTRGHSSIDGWRDAKIKLVRKNDLLTVTVEPRWAPPLEPFTLRFEDGQMVPTNGQKWSPQAKRIRAIAQEHGGTVSRQILGTALSLEPEALRKVLYRVSRDGAISYSDTEVKVRAESPLDGIVGGQS